MKIDTSKIEGYAEMSAEEKLAALEGYELETGMVDKKLLDKANSEAAAYKKQLRETMGEAERKAAEEADARKALEERLKQLEQEKMLSDHKTEFLAIGYDEKNATDAAKALVEGDMKKVFAIQKSFTESQRESIKAELLRDTSPPADGGGKKDSFTKDQFRAMSIDEKQELFARDPDLYKQMTE